MAARAAAFSLLAAGTVGDVADGAFRSPDHLVWDAGMVRNFPSKEATQFQCRAGCFNLINGKSLGNPFSAQIREDLEVSKRPFPRASHGSPRRRSSNQRRSSGSMGALASSA
jgi:hypothetical protein